MPKKVTKPKYKIDPFPPETVAQDVVTQDGIDLPKTTARILRLYYEAFLGQGFTTEQSFDLTLQWTKFYLGTSQ